MKCNLASEQGYLQLNLEVSAIDYDTQFSHS